MAEKRNEDAREAKHGDKMIEVKVRFWTNSLAPGDDQVIPKHGWTNGVVRMEPNKSHGIHPKTPRHFNSLLDMGAVMEKVLLEHGIVLHPSRKMQKYISTE